MVYNKTTMQTTTITVVFTVEHTPGSEEHLQQILRNYLRGKGVTIGEDGKLVI